MSCARYAADLIEIALGRAATGEVGAHLEECAACRAEVARLVGLQSRIDEDLGALLREEPSPAFLARARQRLDEWRPERWLRRLLPVAAALAVVALGVRMLDRPNTPTPEPAPRPARVEPPAPVEAKGDVASASPREPRRVPRPAVPPAEPEVLVPKEQAELLQRLVKAMADAPMPVTSGAGGPVRLEVGRIDVPALQLGPLTVESSELKALRMENGEGAS